MKLYTSNTALFLICEDKRRLLSESIRAIKMWRDNAGNLADIDIYVISITKEIENETYIRLLKIMGVTYIHDPQENLSHLCGWFNMPVGCALAERIIPHEYIIYIDCDLYINRPLPNEYKTDLVLQLDVISIEDKVEDSDDRNKVFEYLGRVYDNQINTQLIITKRSNNMMMRWNDIFNGFAKHIPGMIEENLEYKWIEEYSFDVLADQVEYDTLSDTIHIGGDVYSSNSRDTEFMFTTTHQYSDDLIRSFMLAKQ